MNIAELFIRVTADTEATNRKVAELEKRLESLGVKTKGASAASDGHRLSLGKVERALASYVGHAAGANAVTESLSVAFGSFAVGGGVIAGLLLGIGAVVAVYEHLTEGSRKAREEADKQTKSINDQAAATFALTEAGRRLVVQQTAAQAAAVQKETGAGFFSLLLQGMAPGGQSMGALTTGDAAAKAERLTSTAKAAQNALNELGLTIGRQNTETENRRKQLADEVAAAIAKADAEFQKRIDILSKGLIFEDTRARVTASLIGIEHQLEAQINSGTLSLEKRIIAAQRLGVVMDALAQKFTTVSNIDNTTLASLIGITGNGETAAARANAAYGQPMGTIKYNTDSAGFLVKPGQRDFIGEQNEANKKSIANADKNAQLIASTIESMASVLVSAFTFGGGGRGAGVGGALGGTAGMAVGTLIGNSLGKAGATFGSLLAPGVGTILGTVAGSLLGGLFDHHKKAVDSNTAALNRLTSALINEPTGFKVGYYENQAADPKMLAKLSRTQRQVSSRGGSLGFALAGG